MVIMQCTSVQHVGTAVAVLTCCTPPCGCRHGYKPRARSRAARWACCAMWWLHKASLGCGGGLCRAWWVVGAVARHPAEGVSAWPGITYGLCLLPGKPLSQYSACCTMRLCTHPVAHGRLVPLQQKTQCCADFNTAKSIAVAPSQLVPAPGAARSAGHSAGASWCACCAGAAHLHWSCPYMCLAVSCLQHEIQCLPDILHSKPVHDHLKSNVTACGMSCCTSCEQHAA